MAAELVNENIVFGRNPVKEALKSGRPLDKILVAKGRGHTGLGEITSLARASGVPLHLVDRTVLDSLSGGMRHQGIIAYAAAREYADIEDILARGGDSPLLLLLDEINDPHNLGAILRTAEASGVHGVVIPKRRSASLTPAVAKASAGAVEYMPVVRVANMVQTIEMLKQRGLWIAGADAGLDASIYWEERLSGPLALVIGGEDKGLGRLVREKCDMLVKIPMAGRVGSLNASVAAALILYEVIRQKRIKKHEGISDS